MAEFSLLEPGPIVRPDTGRSNTRLRIHLPLSEPADGEELGIEGGGETRRWRAGRAIAFDDSFVHRVWHNGTTPRLVLIVDIWHPDLTDRYAACARRRRSTELREAERVSACNIAGR